MPPGGTKIAMAGLMSLAGLSLGGCATEDYVNKHVAVVNDRVTALEARVQQVDSNAQAAAQAAQAAMGAAQNAQ